MKFSRYGADGELRPNPCYSPRWIITELSALYRPAPIWHPTLLSLLVAAAAAQDLPPDILADQYLLEATYAIQDGDVSKAMDALAKIELLDTTPPREFAFFRGKLLVENATAMNDILKGQALLKSYVLSIGRDAENYREALRLLSAADVRLTQAETSRKAKEALRAEIAALTEARRTYTHGDNYTLLSYAVSAKYRLEVIAELLRGGADPNGRDSYGRTSNSRR